MNIDNLDLPSVNEEKFANIAKTAKKKGELVKKFLVDENLNDMDRSLLLLKNGSMEQKSCVLEQLPTLFKIHKKSFIDKILQFFLDTLWKESPESQILIGRHIIHIFPLLDEEQMSKLFPLIKSMISLKNKTVSSEWSSVLVFSVQYMPMDLVKGEILEYALFKGSYTESVQNRILCCRLFGAIATRFDGQTIVDTFLDKAITMCQDTEYTVRKCMAEQLLVICQSIGLGKAKETLAKELFQLLEDETKEVKNEAFRTLVRLLDFEFFDHSYRKRAILPYFLQWINNPPKDLYRLLVTHFGEILWHLSSDVTSDTIINNISNFFKEATASKDPYLRQRCAHNFPAVLKTLGANRYPICLHNSYKALCEDEDPTVRKKIAAGFHEVCLILGKEKSVVFLKELFVKLCTDTNEEVQKNIGLHLDVILAHFNVDQSSNIFKELIHVLVDYESRIKNKWRKLEKFYSHFVHFPNYFTPAQLKEVFIPMLRKQLKIGALPVKKQAAKSIVILIRKLKNNQQQVEIFKSLIEEFGKSKSYWDRLTFLEISHHVIERFSRKFFKTHFIEHVLALSKDPVPNVRMKFCHILPLLKQVLRPPSDVELLAIVKENTSLLTLDADPDVIEAAKNAQQELRKIETEMSREHQLNKASQDDKLDKIKEEEENSWIEAEREIEKNRKRQESSKNGNKNGNNKKSTQASTLQSISRKSRHHKKYPRRRPSNENYNK